MATIELHKWAEAQPVITAATGATAAPTDGTNTIIPKNHVVTTFIKSTGTLTGTVQLWVWDGGEWYAGDTYAYVGGNVAVEWFVPTQECWFQFIGPSGTGTITVKVL